jgi:hypothetical protein
MSADPSGTNAPPENRRGSRRIEVSQQVRLQPFDDADGPFTEVTTALDASREGLAFASKHPYYYLNMKLNVTYPFTATLQLHHIGKVVRIQRLDENFQRISVHLESRAIQK